MKHDYTPKRDQPRIRRVHRLPQMNKSNRLARRYIRQTTGRP